jgi:hypothetical protein
MLARFGGCADLGASIHYPADFGLRNRKRLVI